MPKKKNSGIKSKEVSAEIKRSKTSKKTTRPSIKVEQSEQKENASLLSFPYTKSLSSLNVNRRLIIIAVIVALIALLYVKKNLFIAAMVNGSPISNFEVMAALNNQYRTQVLDQMINEKIILDEAKKKGVSVSDAEVNDRIATLEKNVGGSQVLDNLLAQQGQTRSGLRDQIKIQLSVEKLYQNETTSSAEEIQNFIDQNKSQLTATDDAGQRKEAADLLKQQKLSNIFNQKFQQLKQQASIQIF